MLEKREAIELVYFQVFLKFYDDMLIIIPTRIGAKRLPIVWMMPAVGVVCGSPITFFHADIHI